MINYWLMFIVLFCSINPVLSITMYHNVKQPLNQPENILAPLVCSLTVFAILSLSLLYGQYILNFLSIPFYILEIGAGLLVLSIGILNVLANEYMVEARFYIQKIITTFGMASKQDSYKLNYNTLLENYDKTYAIRLGFSPIALPIMINPVSMLIAFFFNGQIGDTNRIAVLLVMLVFSLAIFILLMSSSYLLKKISQIWLLAINRIMGLFLTVIALQMLIDGIKSVIPVIMD